MVVLVQSLALRWFTQVVVEVDKTHRPCQEERVVVLVAKELALP